MKYLFQVATRGSMMLALGLAAACGSSPDQAGSAGNESVGSIHAAITVAGNRHDVTSVEFKIVAITDTCAGPAISDTTTALEAEDLPASVLPAGTTGPHAGADSFLVLPPGNYRVCITPLAGEGPSQACAPAEGTVTVSASATTEVALASQCSAMNGAVDTVAVLTDGPKIESLGILPSKFITQCETAHLTASASSSSGSAVSFSWQTLASPAGATSTLAVSGAQADFSTNTPGDYELQVTATDEQGGASSLSFPIHVSADTCNAPGEFVHAFESGPTTQVSCDEWDNFRGGLTSVSFQSVSMGGSLDPNTLSCSDPTVASQICSALAAGDTASFACDGHTWSVGTCGQELRNGVFVNAIELAIDDSICNCSSSGHSVRPCISLGSNDNPNWGGFGTDTCNSPAQTLRVSCQ